MLSERVHPPSLKMCFSKSSRKIVLSSCFNCFLFTPWMDQFRNSENIWHGSSHVVACFFPRPPRTLLFSFSRLLWFICGISVLTSAYSVSTPNRTSPNPGLSFMLFSFAFYLLKAAQCSAASRIGTREIQILCFGIIVSLWGVRLLWPFVSLC